MFKKSKNTKTPVPPSAPSLDEILSDIETFQVDVETFPTSYSNSKVSDHTSSSVPLESWWKIFEQFINDVKCLEMIHSEVEGYKLKLESHKLEIETEAKLLKNDIEEQQNLINMSLE